jgi:hypothetical protein
MPIEVSPGLPFLRIRSDDQRMLDREEYIEQAFFFRTLRERLRENIPLQDLLLAVKEEVLAHTRLPMAIDFMRGELIHRGVLGTAMQRLSHYFSPYQAYIVSEADDDRSRFDFQIGLEILERESEYKSRQPTRSGLFMFQFESLCRNRLKYDPGLKAISEDPFFDKTWREWILTVRRQIGIVDFADMVYVRSQYYITEKQRRGLAADLAADQVLFGEREGRIALANRRKEPLLMLAALQRQLEYPAVPRPARAREGSDLVAQLARRMERLEQRMKLLDEESRGGIDLTRFFTPPREEERPPGPAG